MIEVKRVKTEGCGKEKNIIILSMSCNRANYINEEKGVRDSWAKDIIDGKYKNIKWYSYRGGKSDSYDEAEHCRHINIPDTYSYTFHKTIKMFEWVVANNKDVDYIVRTNTSNYINVPLLNKFIKNLPYDDKDMYCGEICSCPWFGHKFYGRGNFIIFSRQTIDALIKFGQNTMSNGRGNLTDDFTMFSVLENNVFEPNGEYGKDYLKQVPMTYMTSPNDSYKYESCKDNLVINMKIASRKIIPEKMMNLHKSIENEERKFILPTSFNTGNVHYIGVGKSGRIPYNDALRQANAYYNAYNDKPSKTHPKEPLVNTSLKLGTSTPKRVDTPRRTNRTITRRVAPPIRRRINRPMI